MFLLYALRVILADLQLVRPFGVPDAAAAPAEGPVAEVEVLVSGGEPAPGTRFRVGQAARIGRGPTVEIPVRDAYVSAEHARVYLWDGRYWIEDLGSTNGTLVNGARVTAAVPLDDGDRITIGPIILRFAAAHPASLRAAVPPAARDDRPTLPGRIRAPSP